MSLREEMWKYEQITGESAEHVPIIKLGAFLDGYEMGVKTLEQTRWIPVSERLPDKLNDVIIAFYDCPNEYDVAYLRTTFDESYKKSGAKNEWVSSMGETTYADYEVDAWMPIQPYKVESEDAE